MNKVNFAEKLGLFNEHWSPKVAAQMNDYQFKLVKLLGEFVWHDHPDTDEAFICLSGELCIELVDKKVRLSPGELFVIPKVVKHKPVAEKECHVMIIEPQGVINTGAESGKLTADNDVWI